MLMLADKRKIAKIKTLSELAGIAFWDYGDRIRKPQFRNLFAA
jgi:hypothetical protein